LLPWFSLSPRHSETDILRHAGVVIGVALHDFADGACGIFV